MMIYIFSDTSSEKTMSKLLMHITETLTYSHIRSTLPNSPLTLCTFSQDYIAVKEKNAKYLPHSAGRYAAKRFRKAQCPIVERLTNSLMMHGRNNGKKLMAVRIVKHAFEIIHLLTGENPLQVRHFHLYIYLLTWLMFYRDSFA